MRKPVLNKLSRNVSIALLSLTLGACAVVPQPLPKEDQKSLAAKDRVAAGTNVPPLSSPLTLSEALARGLKYNLDHRTRLMEQALAVGQLDLSNFDMLPKLTAAVGHNWRDSERITSSIDSITGAPSLAHPYISSERVHNTADLGLTWNVLDFGVSYMTAQQNADRVLIAAEHRRKAMHLLMQDVRTAYWRAVAADKIDKDLRESIRLGEQALADSRKVEQEKVRDPLEALRYQRTVLENLRILESIQRELAASKIELAALINLPPGTEIQLAEALDADLNPQRIELPIDQMEELAVENNPDLSEQFYNTRMSLAETKKSLLRMFPGLSFNYTYRDDSDKYLINNRWKEAGAQLSWNIFNLFSLPSLQRYNDASEKLADQRRITTQMAVLAQVHLSRQQYDSAYLLFERADAIWRVDQRIFEHTANREATEVKSQLDKIANNTSAIVSLLRRYQALSQVYSSSSKVQATLGVEPKIGDLNELSLSDLTQQIEANLRQGSWGSTGKVTPAIPTIAAAQAINVAAEVAAAPAVSPSAASTNTPEVLVAPAPADVKSTAVVTKATKVAKANKAAKSKKQATETNLTQITETVEPKKQDAEVASTQHIVIPVAEPVGPVQKVYLGKFAVPARFPSLDWNKSSAKDLTFVSDASQADATANAVIHLSVPKDGKREATIEWQLTDAQGKEIGKVRYVGTVSKPATGAEWQEFKRGALNALATNGKGAQ